MVWPVTMRCSDQTILVWIADRAIQLSGRLPPFQHPSKSYGLGAGSRPGGLPARFEFFELNMNFPMWPGVAIGDAKTELAVQPLVEVLFEELACSEGKLIVVASLGDAEGYAVTPVLLDMLPLPKRRMSAVISVPFPWHGQRVEENASDALREIRLRTSLARAVHPSDVMKILPEPVPMQDAYDTMDRLILDAVQECLQASAA